MPDKEKLKLLFVINNSSGNNQTNWKELIHDYFSKTPHEVDYFELPDNCDVKEIAKKIEAMQPDKVIAVGGDGTIKLVAECLIDKDILLGILPAGSANGMAKELGIDTKPADALDIIMNGVTKQIHLIKVNNELCIHLSDIGVNAFMIREFDNSKSRGMWGYLKASFSVFWKRRYIEVEMKIKNLIKKRKAVMVVIANATKYGTGAIINPHGKLDDDKFEVIVLKRFSIREIFKMMVTHKPYDPAKTEIYQTGYVQINSKRHMHFQVDGEYQGKIYNLKASILPGAINIVVPTGV